MVVKLYGLEKIALAITIVGSLNYLTLSVFTGGIVALPFLCMGTLYTDSDTATNFILGVLYFIFGISAFYTLTFSTNLRKIMKLEREKYKIKFTHKDTTKYKEGR